MKNSPLKILINTVFVMMYLAIITTGLGMIWYVCSVSTMSWTGKIPTSFLIAAVTCTALFYFMLLKKAAIEEEDEQVAKQETDERP